MPRDHYTRRQLTQLRDVAQRAYDRVAKAVDHDPDLDKATMHGLHDYIARVQGALLDLHLHVHGKTQ